MLTHQTYFYFKSIITPLSQFTFESAEAKSCKSHIYIQLRNSIMGDSEQEKQIFQHLKPFKTIRKNFALMGICPKLVTQSYPLNGKIVMGSLLIGSGTISLCTHIFNNAESFSAYTQSIYIASAGGINIALLSILIVKVEELFEFMDRCEEILNSSESNLNSKNNCNGRRYKFFEFFPSSLEILRKTAELLWNQSTRREIE